MSEHSDFGALDIKAIMAVGKGTLARRSDGSLVMIEETMRAGIHRARILGLLEKWFLAGTIGKKDVNAARNFHSDYITYNRQPKYSSSSMIYVDGGRGSVDVESLGHLKERARKRLNAAYAAVGQIATPVIIEVIGDDKPLYQCRVPKDRAKRVILKALPLLAAAYGYK